MVKQASRREIRYVYRGDVERGTGRGYRWHEGYSEDLPGGVSYPWLTKTEAQADAKSRNGRAVFVDRRGEALRAALPIAEPAKKSHAQIKREIDEVLAKKPGSSSGDRPRILKISRGKSFADRRVFVVDVQYPGEELMRVEFAGPSRDIVGPVVMVLNGGQQMFVHDPSRFGTFGQDWIRRFYA